LSGPIPKQFSRLTNLVLLYLYDNQLSGSLPDLGEMTRLTDVCVRWLLRVPGAAPETA
jgi:hypothetical protein